MQAAKEKISNMVSSAKANVDIHKAKAEEKAEKAVAKTDAEKEIAHQRKETKVHEAKMHLHEAKLQHKAEREQAKHASTAGVHGIHEPTAGVQPATAINAASTGLHMAGAVDAYDNTQAPIATAFPATGPAASNYPGTRMSPSTKRI